MSLVTAPPPPCFATDFRTPLSIAQHRAVLRVASKIGTIAD
ncbi:hypothetical protein [Pandoraea sp. NPDC087047]